MIVETMTHAEVYNELERDLPNLERWMDRQCDVIRRYALKYDRNAFPMPLISVYTSPHRIKYIVIAIVMRRNCAGSFFYTFTKRNTPTGNEVFLCKSHKDGKVSRVVFIPHAVQRYAERMKFQQTGDDLIKRMLIRSFDCAFSRDQRLCARGVRCKGDILSSFCTRDGAFLGKQDGNIFIIRTFITYDMMGGLQLAEFSKHREAFERGKDAADELCAMFNNRRTLRINQPIIKKNEKERTELETTPLGGC